MRLAWRPKCKHGFVRRSSCPEYGSASVARAAKVWFGDSRCILVCLSRTGGWTRPLFIPSGVEIG